MGVVDPAMRVAALAKEPRDFLSEASSAFDTEAFAEASEEVPDAPPVGGERTHPTREG
jgi:hypothetical protein